MYNGMGSGWNSIYERPEKSLPEEVVNGIGSGAATTARFRVGITRLYTVNINATILSPALGQGKINWDCVDDDDNVIASSTGLLAAVATTLGALLPLPEVIRTITFNQSLYYRFRFTPVFGTWGAGTFASVRLSI